MHRQHSSNGMGHGRGLRRGETEGSRVYRPGPSPQSPFLAGRGYFARCDPSSESRQNVSLPSPYVQFQGRRYGDTRYTPYNAAIQEHQPMMPNSAQYNAPSSQQKMPQEMMNSLLRFGLAACPWNHAWVRIRGGWKCRGRNHMMTDEQIKEGRGGWYQAAFWSRPGGFWFQRGAVRGQENIEEGAGLWAKLGWKGPIYGKDPVTEAGVEWHFGLNPGQPRGNYCGDRKETRTLDERRRDPRIIGKGALASNYEGWEDNGRARARETYRERCATDGMLPSQTGARGR